ncbi:hypothetical protein HOE22_03840 [Candidatus Woesearchaeota archaeon]|jgi:hypothetical protein|nr:hypothetical protein [Candidatus Woesearchaeota archaeon]MBT5212774.1 hypothetical protein [Candidatus Neomarinimicrobiota bacterium]MBT7830585.1 hypothetical protein [Candidatus Neomarinimicrobiota bacterium]
MENLNGSVDLGKVWMVKNINPKTLKMSLHHDESDEHIEINPSELREILESDHSCVGYHPDEYEQVFEFFRQIGLNEVVGS